MLKTFGHIYIILVRPHCDYCNLIFYVSQKTIAFDSCINLKVLMNTLESTQYHATLAVSGSWKGTNTSKLYEQFGWETLSERWWFRRLLQFYKIFNNIFSPYLKLIIAPNSSTQRVCYMKFHVEMQYIKCWDNIVLGA